MYPELLKRLDDSNDDVRRTICATIAVYFKAPAPGAFSSTCYGYMLDTLLIHLDDPEEDMQECVLGTLNAAIEVVPALVASKAAKAVDSHRDGDMATELAERAAQKVKELEK
jgi:dynein assembly factor 5